MIKHSIITLAAAAVLLQGGEYKAYQKARLLKANGHSLTKEYLKPDVPYFFAYPYKSTPAILVKTELQDENNVSYEKLVAYLAINPNTLEFANNDVSIITYYKEDPFGSEVLRFCDDKSTYAIQDGFNVLDTNATAHLPMVGVRLEERERGRIYAVGLEDDELLKKFFKEKREALTKRFRSMWNAKIKMNKPKAYKDERFSLVTVRCNDKLPPRPIVSDQNLTEENATVLELIDNNAE